MRSARLAPVPPLLPLPPPLLLRMGRPPSPLPLLHLLTALPSRHASAHPAAAAPRRLPPVMPLRARLLVLLLVLLVLLWLVLVLRPPVPASLALPRLLVLPLLLRHPSRPTP